MAIIRVLDYARSPGGRFVSDGPYSGEWFRDEILVPALREARAQGEKVSVTLDGTFGYGTSFLEEAFGGLVRERGFTQSTLSGILEIVANTPLFAPYKKLADRYIAEARSPQMSAA